MKIGDSCFPREYYVPKHSGSVPIGTHQERLTMIPRQEENGRRQPAAPANYPAGATSDVCSGTPGFSSENHSNVERSQANSHGRLAHTIQRGKAPDESSADRNP